MRTVPIVPDMDIEVCTKPLQRGCLTNEDSAYCLIYRHRGVYETTSVIRTPFLIRALGPVPNSSKGVQDREVHCNGFKVTRTYTTYSVITQTCHCTQTIYVRTYPYYKHSHYVTLPVTWATPLTVRERFWDSTVSMHTTTRGQIHFHIRRPRIVPACSFQC